MIYYNRFQSPIGELLLVADETNILQIDMVGEWPTTSTAQTVEIGAEWVESSTVEPLRLARVQLQSYFARKLYEFTLPLAFRGTEFQNKVWRELVKIPYGVSISYGELARRVGNPQASRAVGLANGKNPIAIIVPCHRVIGANGTLTGFGGGLPRKKKLLDIEQSLFE